jgi:hypothetical protein
MRDIIKIHLKKTGYKGLGLDLYTSTIVACSCEQCNEPFCSIKLGNLNSSATTKIINNTSTLWSFLNITHGALTVWITLRGCFLSLN